MVRPAPMNCFCSSSVSRICWRLSDIRDLPRLASTDREVKQRTPSETKRISTPQARGVRETLDSIGGAAFRYAWDNTGRRRLEARVSLPPRACSAVPQAAFAEVRDVAP